MNIGPDPRLDPDDAYDAFMAMPDSEWQGLLASLASGGVLTPAEQKGFERAAADRARRERHDFDHSYRRTGKTTRLCEQIAEALKEDSELRVFLTGAYVMRNRGYYRQLLEERGADMERIKFVPPSDLVRTRGRRGKLFCDDFHDLELEAMRAVVEAERYLS